MSISSAYLLISHGSRDPRPQIAMEELARLVRTKLGTQGTQGMPIFRPGSLSSQRNRLLQGLEADRVVSPKRDATNPESVPLSRRASLVVSSAWYPLVGTAALELAPLPLHEQIQQFANEALSVGCNQVQLLPLFLLPGVHVMEDIPREVGLALASLGQAVALNQQPHVGAHSGLVRILASQLATVDTEAKILLSHGSRRPGGNEAVAAVAEQLGAVVAYWSVKPTLEEQLNSLAAAGHKRIAILPYFLFSGGITDAIAKMVTSLQEQFPTLQLTLAQPIGASPELADMIVDLIEEK